MLLPSCSANFTMLLRLLLLLSAVTCCYCARESILPLFSLLSRAPHKIECRSKPPAGFTPIHPLPARFQKKSLLQDTLLRRDERSKMAHYFHLLFTTQIGQKKRWRPSPSTATSSPSRSRSAAGGYTPPSFTLHTYALHCTG